MILAILAPTLYQFSKKAVFLAAATLSTTNFTHPSSTVQHHHTPCPIPLPAFQTHPALVRKLKFVTDDHSECAISILPRYLCNWLSALHSHRNRIS